MPLGYHGLGMNSLSLTSGYNAYQTLRFRMHAYLSQHALHAIFLLIVVTESSTTAVPSTIYTKIESIYTSISVATMTLQPSQLATDSTSSLVSIIAGTLAGVLVIVIIGTVALIIHISRLKRKQMLLNRK